MPIKNPIGATSRHAIAGVDKPLSPLILGTASYHPDQSHACFALMDAYADAGGTVIDTAPAYGESEQVVGRWLEHSKVRERIILITKCGHGPDFTLRERDYPKMVRQELACSLEALRTDVLDLYMLHRDNLEIPVSTILEPLNEAIQQGRVRALGASNWEYRRVSEANEYAAKHGLSGFVAVSNNLSLARPAAAFFPGLVHTDTEGELWHARTGVPVLAWSPTARGFFNGIINAGMRDDESISKPAQSTFFSRMIKVYGTDENFGRLKRAAVLGERKGGWSAVEVALAWLLHRPFACIPIIGPRRPEELVSSFRALKLDLSPEEVDWLDIGCEGRC